ncbi:helix-turn-helix domain-containing protein [Flavobacterium soyangense]|uniref:Transposase n=1 Tax=Flavobacterium soyangense TaxID=2023265 RepID=A0A930U9K9_9FLAO|nr:transposase [Flavobacterium soyangense]MBF2708005.1 transposase [Flavobacterium soyangense]
MERKVKYDYAFKLECVKLVLEKHYSCNYVSTQKGLNESNIRKCVGFYRQYGDIGLLPRKNQSYSVNFILKVLKAIDKDLLSLRDSSIKFNIPDSGIIVKWKKDFANFGLVGLLTTENYRNLDNRPLCLNYYSDAFSVKTDEVLIKR